MPRILVADDNTNIQKMVVLAFEERGVDVVAVGNGEAAVRRIPDVNPDLVLADVFMPVRNGYEVCEFVKKDTRFAHVPVILLVGAFDPLDEKEARRVGADGVLKKPFVPPDPLIAMVMSALEKNPKIAAELAKAREVPVAPPPPPVMEIAAKAEPKPLPEFPEPTAEEAAAIYGFGKGVRSMGDEVDEPDESEAKAPKAPVAKAEVDVDDEDDFDGAATATDWRRTGGMDFEIPENTAVDPGYSYGKDGKEKAKDEPAITFPSEKEVPPRHIRVRDNELEAMDEPVAPFVPPIAQQIAHKPLEPSHPGAHSDGGQSFAPYGMKLSTEPSSNEDAPAAWHESLAFQSASNQPATIEEEPAPAAFTPKKEEAPATLAPAAPAASISQVKDSTPVPATAASSSAPSTPWTPLTAPASEYPESSWMSESHWTQTSRAPVPERTPAPVAVSSSQPETLKAPEPPPAPLSAEPSWLSKSETASRAEHSAVQQGVREQAREDAREEVREEAHEESRPRKKSWFSDAIEAVREVVQGGSHEPAEEPIRTAHIEPVRAQAETTALVTRPSIETTAGTSAREVARESAPPVDWQSASPVQQHRPSSLDQQGAGAEAASRTPEPPIAESKSGTDAQLLSALPELAPSRKDPALERPVAAHVTPEPLLVRDETPASPRYGEMTEPVAPLQSFPLPGESEPVNGEPAADLVATNHEEVPAFVASSEISAAEESMPADLGERIPTAPPPNREALAGIPFLMPTAAALDAVNAPQEEPPAAAAAGPNMDEMVQKVLERLEPQLHELLSKSLLKPLVENMLQNELAKKDK